MIALFDLGVVCATPGALDTVSHEEMLVFLRRHSSGDWGDIPPADRKENEYSLKHGFRLLSSYPVGDGSTVWIISEADWSSTTILLPSEY